MINHQGLEQLDVELDEARASMTKGERPRENHPGGVGEGLPDEKLRNPSRSHPLGNGWNLENHVEEVQREDRLVEGLHVDRVYLHPEKKNV